MAVAMMDSFAVLPELPLRPLGRDSKALLAAGCTTYRGAARFLRELRYGRNSDRADYRLVLEERVGTCSTKHALLAAVAREQDLPVDLTVGIYEMAEANTPGVGRVLREHGLDGIPEAHCYLRIEGRRVDITRSGVVAAEPIARFEQEWSIEPSQIGEFKLQLHHRYLREWLSQNRDLPYSFDEIWRIREACIAALGSHVR